MNIFEIVFLQWFENISFRIGEGAKPVWVVFLFVVAPTALGLISSCRPSETHGQKPGGNICACP